MTSAVFHDVVLKLSNTIDYDDQKIDSFGGSAVTNRVRPRNLIIFSAIYEGISFLPARLGVANLPLVQEARRVSQRGRFARADL